MKNITLWQRLRQVSISTSLRCAFLMGALLTLIVSSVSLYSWHEQSSQIRYSLDEYFPRIHSAFLIEGNLNLVVDQLNEFLQAPNTTVRLQLRTQIIQHLDTIERLSRGLSSRERQQLTVILRDSRSLLSELDRALYNMFLLREKVSELSARIDWLHDDFTTELNSLVQDFTWQQVYTLARIENQIVDDLRDRLNELKSGRDDDTQVETHLRYFENLKKTADENIRMLDDWPGTITLRQTIDELLDMGIVKNKMPDTMREYVAAQKALEDASRTREATLGRFRTLLEAQLGSTHQQMQMFNQRMEQIVRVSGGLILVATALALLLAWVFNHYFIRSRLVKRFTLLNQAVVQIGLGGTETTIPVYGNDELGRIAGLLRHTLGQLNVQKQQLEQEITDRKVIEADLRATQDELIQTAKLAVVGQTMTTLAHEINQPLNALSMYLFTARRAIEQTQKEQASMMLGKAEGVISRIDAIIRSLRQFTRRAELETSLHAVDLAQMFSAAWELLAMRHRSLQATLVLPQGTATVSGDEVRTQQVLVNVLANALDVCGQGAVITVNWQMQGKTLNVFIGDNGPGWPEALLPSLLKPFTTSKEVGLGIGLSICVSLMEQMKGELRLASTMTRNACVVLQFRLTDVEDAK
ncbi:ATP-binding protein [Escherichia coli]|uniref:ATP-binding protein n=1 Tax=Escherichia coli TaxID=562 RepID=UPI000D6F78E5|nr:ATP-binding protein [Escherichia coli]MDM8581836.1 ATP-binding protein [Escherichia coli]BDP11019.1 two-component sensor histidine kinase [Escherichia coli]HAH2923821.1 sensor histidine kinase [Escherichia coli]